MNPSNPIRQQQAGVTLVELMVVVVLAGILSGGLFFVMAGQQKTYQHQHRIMANQSNASGALQFMQRELRRAGYGISGCPRGEVLRDADGGGPTDRELSEIVAIRVHNDCNIIFTDPAGCGGANDGVDSLTISYSNTPALGTMPGVRLLQNLSTTHQSQVEHEILVPNDPTNQHEFEIGDHVVLWQTTSTNQECVAVVVTSKDELAAGAIPVPHTDLVYDSSNPYNPQSTDDLLAGQPMPVPGAVAVRFGPGSAPRHFAIDNRLNPPRLVTWRTFADAPGSDFAGNPTLEVVADGIEDMQIALACDTEPNNVINEGKNDTYKIGVADEWQNNAPNDIAVNCNGQNWRVARVTLVARSTSPDIGNMKGFAPKIEDHCPGGGAGVDCPGKPSQDLAQTGGLGTYNRLTLTTNVNLFNLR